MRKTISVRRCATHRMIRKSPTIMAGSYARTAAYKEGLAQLERALRSRLYQTPDRAYVNAGQCAMAMGDKAG